MGRLTRQWYWICPTCGKIVQFFSRKSAAAYPGLCPNCFGARMKLRSVTGEPDPYSGYVPVSECQKVAAATF